MVDASMDPNWQRWPRMLIRHQQKSDPKRGVSCLLSFCFKNRQATKIKLCCKCWGEKKAFQSFFSVNEWMNECCWTEASNFKIKRPKMVSKKLIISIISGRERKDWWWINLLMASLSRLELSVRLVGEDEAEHGRAERRVDLLHPGLQLAVGGGRGRRGGRGAWAWAPPTTPPHF